MTSDNHAVGCRFCSFSHWKMCFMRPLSGSWFTGRQRGTVSARRRTMCVLIPFCAVA